MSLPAEEPRSPVGHRLRTLRQARGHSLSEVAAATGLSKSFLSLVENGQSDISIGRLMRVARFFGVTVSDLLAESGSGEAVHLTPRDQRHLISRAEGMDIALLAPPHARALMPVLVTFEPGGATSEPVAHVGEELVYVLEGALSVELAGESPLVLRAGDSAYFSVDRPHSYRNVADGRTRAFVVATPRPL